MRVCGLVYVSNHYQLLIRPASVRQMAAFMRDVNYKISKEVGYLHEWEGTVWPRPYDDVQVSDEAEAQIYSLRYLLEQGCKEGLVASPKHWPGASSAKALLLVGGGGGIRTRGAREGSLVFKTWEQLLTATAHNRWPRKDGDSQRVARVMVSGESGEELRSSGP